MIASAALAGCGPSDDPPVPAVLAEGVFGPLGTVRPNATAEEMAAFERGREVALQRYTPEEGFGPEFNASFCVTCHEKPVFGGSAGRYRNFVISAQTLSDGSQTPLGKGGVQNHYTIGEAAYLPTEANANTFLTRNPIPFFGVGLLAEIPGEEISKRADPDDADGDGISGRVNTDRGFVGRFGRKSQTVSIEGFIRGPLFNHLGITTDPLTPDEKSSLPVPSAASGAFVAEGDIGVVKQAQAAAPDESTVDDDGVADPELPSQDLFDLVSFSMLLAAPEPPEVLTPVEEDGQRLFGAAGCESCHVPALEGPRGLIPAYSDLLIHDMGQDMSDGLIQGVATGSEFRTQPLWGIGPVGPYLHDGRADTLDEAIRHHGGEGSAARDAYVALSADEQEAITAFLRALGGADQYTEGLIPPETPMDDVGEYGGPFRDLSGEEADRFLRGRSAFDRDRFLSEGLGERFNGDSCRACHFDPVPGGAGPLDVNVVRQGIFDGNGFTAPAMGTVTHRHSAATNLRNPVDEAANFFEQRQTPPLFGLGLIELIPEATILAHEDPDNTTGISGRANMLPGGQVGRFGWKADIPSVDEFARDATSTELGFTLPEQMGLTFGKTTDGDGVADPEIPMSELGDLVFWLKMLAAPPRVRTDTTLEDQGEAVFATAGCDGCHIPSMQTMDGMPVELYSDLLLHDVTAPGTDRGIASADASITEFRTTPLWGLGRTAPYWHDGRASTIAAAIRLHFGEAEAARAAYEGLSQADEDALLAFLRSL